MVAAFPPPPPRPGKFSAEEPAAAADGAAARGDVTVGQWHYRYCRCSCRCPSRPLLPLGPTAGGRRDHLPVRVVPRTHTVTSATAVAVQTRRCQFCSPKVCWSPPSLLKNPLSPLSHRWRIEVQLAEASRDHHGAGFQIGRITARSARQASPGQGTSDPDLQSSSPLRVIAGMRPLTMTENAKPVNVFSRHQGSAVCTPSEHERTPPSSPTVRRRDRRIDMGDSSCRRRCRRR